MLLAVDIGNTHWTVGAFRGGRLLKLWRLATDPRKTADEYGMVLSSMVSREEGRVESVIYGSVVPALDAVFESASRAYFGAEAEAVTWRSPLGIRLRVDRPQEVGVDRLLNALAVARLHGGPAVVIDFGTATTFDCLSASGDYLGGAILIGPRLAAQALAERTAQLPLVELRKPRKVIGTNTVECIQAGLYHGYLGMIDRVLEDTLRELKPAAAGRRPRVLVTGGLGGIFSKDLGRPHVLVPDLTLQGLRLAHEALAATRA